MGGDFRADDIGPAGDDFGRSEALRLEAVAQGSAQELRKRPGKTARGLVHLDFSMAHDLIRKLVPTFRDHARGSHAIVGAMSVAVRLPRRKKAEAPDPVDLLAWYDRHRRSLPWRARRGETPRPLSGLAVGDYAAADHSEDGRALLRQVSGALADGRGACRGQSGRRAARLGRPRLLR